MKTDTVLICETCRTPDGPATGEGLARALRVALNAEGLADVAVETVVCMNICTEPVSVALKGPTKETYLVCGVEAATDLSELVGLVRLFAEAEGGGITDARAAGRLRHCLKGRVPVAGTPVT